MSGRILNVYFSKPYNNVDVRRVVVIKRPDGACCKTSVKFNVTNLKFNDFEGFYVSLLRSFIYNGYSFKYSQNIQVHNESTVFLLRHREQELICSTDLSD
jgi:hypothetical protein